MDDTGAFRSKGVATQFKFFKKCDDNILKAFSNFGVTTQVPDDIIVQMERYVCLLYGNSYDKNIKGKYLKAQHSKIYIKKKRNLEFFLLKYF